MRLEEVLNPLDALEREGVKYAVFGAIAMAAHGLDRATRDLDLFVAPDEENVARLRSALSSVFGDPSIAEITAEDLEGKCPAIQYEPPNADYTIDIVSRLGSAFTFDDLEIMTVDAGGTPIRVVSPSTLFRMKRNTVRGRDRDERGAHPASLRSRGLAMGVRKYRRVEDMPETPPSPTALDGLASTCALAEACLMIGITTRAPRGVVRFRSIEEADTHRQSWEMPPASSF